MDLYSSVFRWAHRQGENFTTDAFCFLLQEMLRRENDSALGLLNWICFETEKVFNPTNTPVITTQVRSDSEGVPDICVCNATVLVLIEVKKGSDLNAGQLRRYRKILEHKRKEERFQRTQLVLLTAFDASFDPDEAPDRTHLRWSEVERRLSSTVFKDSVIDFLARHFVTFLKEQVMASEQVTWQLVEGTKSLVALTDMTRQALENLRIPVHQGSSGWAYRGHYTGEKRYWVGVSLNSPQIVLFQFEEAKPDSAALMELGWVNRNGAIAKTLDLESEECHFFARAKEQQLDELQRFIGLAFQQAESHRLRL